MPRLTSVHVLGAGSLGTLWAAHLAKSKVHTTLLMRQPAPSKVHLQITSGTSTDPTEVTVDAEPSSGPGRPITTLVVATKAFAVADAMAGVVNRLDHGAPSSVVLLMNGALSVADELRLPPTCSLLVATTTHGAFLTPPPASARTDCPHVLHRHVVHAGIGRTWVGQLPLPAVLADAEDAAVRAASRSMHGRDDFGSRSARLAVARQRRAERAMEEFGSAGLGAEVEEIASTERRLWLKLAANAVLNPLTALWNVRNRGVLERLEGLHLAREVVSEVSSLAFALVPPRDLERISNS